MIINRKIKIAMVGGGRRAFIGSIHRIAFHMDGMAELVAGALSSDEANAKASGADLLLDPNRTYTDFRTMIITEASQPVESRPDVVCIVTPNHVHFEPAKLALEHGFHVAIDKPITFSTDEAQQLADIQARTGKLLLLTYTYTGYPMIKQARQLVASGTLGSIRKVMVEYPQGWLSAPLENEGNIQASWRTNPAKSGKAGAMGDIGTHAFNLLEYVSQLKVTHVCADIQTAVKGRQLDDDGSVLLKLNNGATGILVATQIACGEENNLRIRVYGDKGGLDWQQEQANSLKVMWPDRPAEIYRTGTPYLSSYATHNSRTPAGHPEGYLEAFANHYRNFFLCILAQEAGESPQQEWQDYPTTQDGIRGMQFIDRVIESKDTSEKWIEF